MTKTTKTTKTTATADVFASIQVRFVDALTLRSVQPENDKCKTIITDLNEVKTEAFKRQLEAVVTNGFLTVEALENLASACAITDAKNSDYVALKVITKIISTIDALATKQRDRLNNYVNAVFLNIAKNQTLTTKSGLVALSKQVTYSETEQVQSIARVLSVAPSTASTQLSQIRQLVRLMNIGHAVKNKKGDAVSFNETPQACAIVAFYA
jgi:hypothetical protein